MARGGVGSDCGHAVHLPAGQRRDGDNGANNLLLRVGFVPIAQPSVLQLSGCPSLTQLFILLLLAYLIFTIGHFLEGFYDRSEITLGYISKNVYNILAISIFIMVLWRHYQKETRKDRVK